ncbi:hypothetical protein B0H67DRAFT_643120 [Lasiosphaeris hirsuta]|uniref:Uncharacterized protein n=1 Tax=Lasiosphaeris hirsuta TaxID=260670 RepID=A0AA40APY9_9PEZI|nr:hypothetical protein B0H67DRAFT_643120 [Lasiosphaeris hirsuta]
MKAVLGYAAVGCALGAANAKVLKWSRDENTWVPAQQTLGFMPALVNPEIPAPTAAPTHAPRGLLQKRATSDDNTCAYVSGSADYPLYCDATAYCASNSINSHIGCCADTTAGTATKSCNVWTACYDSADASSYTTDNGFTLWCGFKDYPHCITHVYHDEYLSGYTLLGCAVAAGTDKVYYTPFIFSTTSSTKTASSSTSPTTSIPDARSFTSPSTTGTATPTISPTPAPASAPTGAIVGGVVGGIGAIALVVMGIWLLIRQKNKNKDSAASPVVAAAASTALGPGGPPAAGSPMTQNTPPPAGGYYNTLAGAYAPVDPRASIAKPPYSTNTQSAYDANGNLVSPPGSPPPQSPLAGYNNQPPQQYQGQQYNNTPSPPPVPSNGTFAGYGQQPQYGQQQQQQQAAYNQSPQGYSPPLPQQQPYGNQGYGQQQAYQHPQGHPQTFAAELPTQRGDGQVNELA